jgi:uncharacterized protein (DUF3084 family)
MVELRERLRQAETQLERRNQEQEVYEADRDQWRSEVEAQYAAHAAAAEQQRDQALTELSAAQAQIAALTNDRPK